MSATLLVAEKVQRRHGERVVIDGADLRIGVDSRIGLIGANGSGKTTLLRVLAGLDRPDAGTVTSHGTVGLLRQTPEPSQTGRAAILDQIGITQATAVMEHHARRLASGDIDAIDAHAEALERWLALGGADVEARMQAVATEFGLTDELLTRPLSELSGGQASRVGLAALALARHDVILLDEPTNHLDNGGLEKLRGLIAARRGAVVIVSHNRQLLSDICTEIVTTDRRTGRLTHYHGGYESYERERELARNRALSEHREAVQERRRLEAVDAEIRRRAIRAVKTASAKTGTRDNDKFSREFVKARGEEMASRARKLGSRIERVEVPEKPWEERALRLRLTAAERRQPWIVSLEQARWERPGWSLGPLDLTIGHGERLLLRGANGSGKSTILATIAGRLQPSSGHVETAKTAVIAALGQTRTALEQAVAPLPNDAAMTGPEAVIGPAKARSVTDAVRALTGLDRTEARNALAWFGLKREQADQPPDNLSPGELTRAELAVLAHKRASCLLLDEPTNHLDIESVEVLEAALEEWPGALIVATHDTRMIERLAPDRELVL